MSARHELEGFQTGIHRISAATIGLFVLGLALALATKVSTTGVVIGWGISIGVPVLMGFFTGLYARVGSVGIGDPRQKEKRFTYKKLCLVFLILAFAYILIGTGYFIIDLIFKDYEWARAFMKGGLSGLYCTSMTCLVFGVPIFLGLLLSICIGGFVRKVFLKWNLKPKTQFMIWIVLSLIIPNGLDGIERHLRLRDHLKNETIVTIRDVPAGIGTVWDHLQFYEDTGSESAWLFLVGFPKPIKTEGLIAKPGDITKCIYDKGYLVKRTTEVALTETRGVFKFDVVEQVNIENRAIRLLNGQFLLEQKKEGQTVLKLQTTYRPLMTPRFMWRPLEKLTAKALHNHVIDKISKEVPPELNLTGI